MHLTDDTLRGALQEELNNVQGELDSLRRHGMQFVHENEHADAVREADRCVSVAQEKLNQANPDLQLAKQAIFDAEGVIAALAHYSAQKELAPWAQLPAEAQSDERALSAKMKRKPKWVVERCHLWDRGVECRHEIYLRNRHDWGEWIYCLIAWMGDRPNQYYVEQRIMEDHAAMGICNICGKHVMLVCRPCGVRISDTELSGNCDRCLGPGELRCCGKRAPDVDVSRQKG